MMESLLVPHVYYPDDTSNVDRCVLEEFVKSERAHPLKPLPMTSVIELPNRHRYQYTPSYDKTGECTYTFERIVDWP